VKQVRAKAMVSRLGRQLPVVGAAAALSLAAVAATAAPASAAPTSGASVPSGDAPFTLSVPYVCDFPILGPQSLDATISGSAPQVVSPGQSFSLTGVQSTTTIPSSLVDALLLVQRSVSGTIKTWDFAAQNAHPSAVNGAKRPISFGPVSLTSGQPVAITAPPSPATIGPFTASNNGNVTVSAGDLDLTTWFGQLHCTPSGRSGASSLTIAMSRQPLPVNTAIGGLGAAGIVGAAFIWRQRRRSPGKRAAARLA
jgi:hypothetical protein